MTEMVIASWPDIRFPIWTLDNIRPSVPGGQEFQRLLVQDVRFPVPVILSRTASIITRHDLASGSTWLLVSTPDALPEAPGVASHACPECGHDEYLLLVVSQELHRRSETIAEYECVTSEYCDTLSAYNPAAKGPTCARCGADWKGEL